MPAPSPAARSRAIVIDVSDLPPPNPYASPDYNPYAAPTAQGYAPAAAPLLQHEFFQIPAPVLTRIGAHLIDIAVIVGLMLGFALLAGVFAAMTGTEVDEGTSNAIAFFGLLPGVILQCILQASVGRSLGKLLLRIRVVTIDGLPAGFARVVLLRNLFPLSIQMFCGILSIADLLSLFRMDGRTIHDRVAGTKVVRVS